MRNWMWIHYYLINKTESSDSNMFQWLEDNSNSSCGAREGKSIVWSITSSFLFFRGSPYPLSPPGSDGKEADSSLTHHLPSVSQSSVLPPPLSFTIFLCPPLSIYAFSSVWQQPSILWASISRSLAVVECKCNWTQCNTKTPFLV